MKIVIKFEKVYDIYIQHGCCVINIHQTSYRFFNDYTYCYNNADKMKIKQICRRLNKRFEWDDTILCRDNSKLTELVWKHEDEEKQNKKKKLLDLEKIKMYIKGMKDEGLGHEKAKKQI